MINYIIIPQRLSPKLEYHYSNILSSLLSFFSRHNATLLSTIITRLTLMLKYCKSCTDERIVLVPSHLLIYEVNFLDIPLETVSPKIV